MENARIYLFISNHRKVELDVNNVEVPKPLNCLQSIMSDLVAFSVVGWQF